MTETMANLELNKYLSDDVPEEKKQSGKRPLQFGALLAVLLLIACYFASHFVLNERKAELLDELKVRQEITVQGKAETLRTWLDETGGRANQIANNPLFQLFAAEVNQSGGGNLPRALSTQLPYMQNAITSFVQQSEIIAAYVVGEDGRAYLASSGAPALSEGQRQQAVDHYSSSNISASPLKAVGDDLVLDFLVPVFSAQSATDDQKSDVVGILVMTVSASAQLTEILKPSRLSLAGEETHLYQMKDGRYHRITPQQTPYISESETGLSKSQLSEFSLKALPGSLEPVFAVGTDVDGTSLALLQGETEMSALASLKNYSYFVYGLAGSFFIVVISVYSGILFSMRSSNAKAMADQYRDFAHQINAQRRLLGSINNTIDELIGLTDGDGKYVYANPALARFTNFPMQSIPGKTDRDLFGDQTSRKLMDMNRQVLDTRQSANAILEHEGSGETRIIRVDKSRLLDDDGLFMGIVTVAGDITDYVMHQRQKEELGRKTISILVHMMEDNDPYLAGHSQRMSELSHGISEVMDLPDETRQVLLTGANLSQIGKISIPSEIRTKESRLTKSEMEIMQSHVGKADILLNDMEIDQSVITAVTQMYERQDGSGYPNALEGSDIDICARILGLTDILVARVSPRSYRKAISVEEAMEVFRTNPEKYDQDVVAALDNFLTTPLGEAFKDSLR
ncbi:MAG: HD domain-containing phosphohydrolase [Sneathiella sp.]